MFIKSTIRRLFEIRKTETALCRLKCINVNVFMFTKNVTRNYFNSRVNIITK